MIAYFISIFPIAATALCSIIASWLICKFWYNAHYVHVKEVRPMQEAQSAMQNQYSILAERIKNSDQRLQDLSQKLEAKTREAEEANIKLALLESRVTHESAGLSNALRQELINFLEVTKAKQGVSEETEKNRLKELTNIMRQNIQELKMDFGQKINSSATLQTELSAQIWQLLEMNKKLTEETATLSKTLDGLTDKTQERPFTLASIQKRS